MNSQTCPQCGYELEAHTGIGDATSKQPSVGDITVCFGCASILSFNEKMELVLPSPVTLRSIQDADMSTWEMLQKIQKEVLNFRLGHKNKPQNN